ncbi:MAG TPA: biotin/lipoate A/B protein ligase family protein [Candidatus Acidoferrum sp.]|nr:biotin/lipoate A/B protein ligase family protein [Candidatus Acidoferrum sp.]
MVNWRLLELETSNACRNMAIDESILVARTKGLAPDTLRFYRWRPSAVSIGRFQDLELEVQLASCRNQGVDIVRRITGGGTVYHDAIGEITYSAVVSKQDLGTSDIDKIYARLYSGLVAALKILGIITDFNEGNTKACPNLTTRGKKISGSAQTHKAGVVLQHGTLLSDVNLGKMFDVIRVPWAKTREEVINIANDRITSINSELGKRVSSAEVTDALVRGFSQALNVELVSDELTPYELDLAADLQEHKYANDDWTFHCKSLPL